MAGPQSNMNSHLSSHSVISGVKNLNLFSPIFNFSPTVNQNHHPNGDSENVADWLSNVNRLIQNDTFSKCADHTGTWFIEHPKFQKWLSGDIPVLCVKGPPGVGKTFLSSIVIHHLESTFVKNREDIAVIFAYCRYTDQHSISDILASFVKQLAARNPRVLPIVETVNRDHLLLATRPIRKHWLESLRPLLPLFDRVYIVIDALDELPDDARDALLNGLRSLQGSLFITSRPSNAFQLLRDVEYVEIRDENEGDIELFIHQRFQDSSNLTRLLRDREPDRTQIYAELKKTSKNMFLVAALHIDSLEHSTTTKRLIKAAKSLKPESIHDLYSASWERIKAQPKERFLLARKAIIWLTYAYRLLKIIELQHALAGQSVGETFDNDDVADEELIVSVCCGLIVIDTESQIVHFAHSTAIDFFKSLGHNLHSTPHTLMSTRCLSYLSAPKFSTDGIPTRKDLKVYLRAKEYPLRDYAFHHWGHHAAHYEERNLPDVVSGILSDCIPDPYPCIRGGHFDLFERCHVAVYYELRDMLVGSIGWHDQRTRLLRVTPLMLACVRGDVKTIELILSRSGVDTDAQDKFGQTAFIMASANGHDAVAQLLLSRSDVAVNTQAEKGRTALMAASQNGHHSVAQLLLSRNDIAVNTQAEDGRTALIMASQNGHDAVVQLLLSRSDIVVNTQAENGGTALMAASENGHDTVVKLLLSCSDVAVNTQAENGGTALMVASQNGHDAVVQLLLSCNDLAVNTQAENGGTALMLASKNGHDAVVQLLLSRSDVAVNTQAEKDWKGWTVLMAASWNGHHSVAQLLLSHNDIAVNTQAENGRTALIMASQNGHDTVVQLLLCRSDVAVNTQAENGGTALMAASSNGHHSVAQLLLSRNDIAVNTQAENGGTALMAASENGHGAVVQLLLSRSDVAVNTQTEKGWTALMLASQNGHHSVAQLLLSCNDIAVNTQAENGGTALMLASQNVHDAVVQLLLCRSDLAVNTQAENGGTALMAASENGHETVVKLR